MSRNRFVMSQQTDNKLAEHGESLWMLVTSPTVWAAHFLASYLTAAIWCAKAVDRSGLLHTVRFIVGGYTVAALAAITVTGWLGWRRVSFKRKDLPHDGDTPLDRYRFLGFATLLLSGLSFIATLFVAAVFVFMETCD